MRRRRARPRANRIVPPRLFGRTATLATVLAAITLVGGCSDGHVGGGEEESSLAPSTSASGPPEVPENADNAEERRAVADALWEAGSTRFAADAAAPDRTTVRKVDSEVPPDGWRLLLFRSTLTPDLGVYAVAGPENETFALSANPSGYQRFAESAELRISDEDEALAAAEFFLDTTRRASDHQKVLHKGSDALLSEADPEAKESAEERIDEEIEPPKVRQAGDDYEITLYLQRITNVDKWTGTVSANGSVDGSFATVAEDLPVSFRTP